MPVVGFVFNSIDAKRSEEPVVGRVDVQSTPTILSISEKNVPFFSDKPLLDVNFDFKTNYGKFGNVKIQGEIFYAAEDGKKTVKDWNKNKKLPMLMDMDIRNFCSENV